MSRTNRKPSRARRIWRAAQAVFAAGVLLASASGLARTLHVYGPGGPAPAMKEVAQSFERRTGTRVIVTAGPSSTWLTQAKANGDIIFSGSENMMSDFLRQLGSLIAAETVEPLYIGPSTILVRPGNPRAIRGVRDLAREGYKIMVVGGAGQIGMWEDVVARTGERQLLAGFRRNIAVEATSSGEALERWKQDPAIDAWLIWNHWQIANADVADAVPVEQNLRIWRPMDAGLMARSKDDADARRFFEFLTSPEARAIFEKSGWSR
ncbi:MAG TPA: substrate-binding domain-containing protein [Sphingomicrobium sp.]|nr:substrate-binding domain-containing protein [Sphingomicrobium sp.]